MAGGLIALVVAWAVDRGTARGWAFAASNQVTCGDAEHCLVAGSVTDREGNPDEVLALQTVTVAGGLATTADGGRTWHSVFDEALNSSVGYSFQCWGANCWAPEGPDGVLEVHIDQQGFPHLTEHNFGPYFWTYPGFWGDATCVSLTQCFDLSGGARSPGAYTVLRTTDSGAHWSFTSNPLPAGISSPIIGPSWCSAQGVCLAAMDGSPEACTGTPVGSCTSTTLMRSEDGGQTWSPTASPLSGQVAVWCGGGGVCTATHYPVQSPATHFAVSTDEGLHWGRPIAADPRVSAQVLCSTSRLCIAPGAGRTGSSGAAAIWQSSDGGRNWRSPYAVPSGWQLEDVGCGPDGRCLAAIEGPGRVMRIVGAGAGQTGRWTVATVPRPVAVAITVRR